MYKNNIKSWAVNERPREKFIQKGKYALSDTELLAILIRSGTTDRSAIVVAQDVLQLADNNLAQLAKLSMKDLLRIKGVGQTKAITIMTALELGKRRRLSEVASKSKIRSSNDVFLLMKPILEDLIIEQFWVLYLNNANTVIAKHKISEGGITATIVDVRLILKHAIQEGSTALVLCHNHPSGNLKPSEADISLTNKVKSASEIMDVQVLDHLIVTDQSYFSFADQGRI